MATDYITEALTMRLDAVRAKLQARDGVPGFEANTAELRVAIEQLEAEIERRKPADSDVASTEINALPPSIEWLASSRGET